MPIDAVGANAHRYPTLDALRGAAAFAVLFYHLRNIGAGHHGPAVLPIFASGYLAVDLFFVLSGFVISHAYGARLRKSLPFRAFMTARFVRLQPVIAIGTLIGFILALVQRLLGLEGAPGLFAILTCLPANLLMLPNVLMPSGIFLFNPPAWSLFYELAANAVYAFAVRRGANSTNGMRENLLLAASCLAGFGGLAASVLLVGDLDRGVALGDWPVALARIIFSFTAGALLHRTRHRWMKGVPRLPLPWLLIACVALLAPDFHGAPRAIYDLTFATALSPVLLMLTCVAQPGPRLQSASAWLGMISYPLYAVHAPIKHVFETILPLGFAPMLIVATCSAVSIAWLIGTVIDPALRHWLGNWQCRLYTTADPHVATTSSLSGGA